MSEILHPYRQKIDQLDNDIVDLLVQREKIIHDVAAIKKEHNIPAVLPDRVDAVRDRCEALAKEKGMTGDYVREIYRTIIQQSCELEDSILEEDKPL